MKTFNILYYSDKDYMMKFVDNKDLVERLCYHMEEENKVIIEYMFYSEERDWIIVDNNELSKILNGLKEYGYNTLSGNGCHLRGGRFIEEYFSRYKKRKVLNDYLTL